MERYTISPYSASVSYKCHFISHYCWRYIAALAGTSESILIIRVFFGFIAIILAAINIFGGFLVTQRILQMYKRKIKRNDFSEPSSNFFGIWNIIYSCFEGIIITRHVQTRKLLWNSRNDNRNSCYIPINW